MRRQRKASRLLQPKREQACPERVPGCDPRIKLVRPGELFIIRAPRSSSWPSRRAVPKLGVSAKSSKYGMSLSLMSLDSSRSPMTLETSKSVRPELSPPAPTRMGRTRTPR